MPMVMASTMTGSPYNGIGRGRGWPLLTGEHGHYELAAGCDPLPFLEAMTRMPNPDGMLPEQVWDADPGQRSRLPCCHPRCRSSRPWRARRVYLAMAGEQHLARPKLRGRRFAMRRGRAVSRRPDRRAEFY